MAAAWIIDTDVDASTTLSRMARLARKAIQDPRVVHVANRVVDGIAPRDVDGQIEAIYDFLNDVFRFVPNPIGTQTIRPPGWTGKPDAPGMLEDLAARGIVQGACDDAAVLAATIALADGIPARYRAIAFCVRLDGVCDPVEGYTHVITDLWDGQDWRELDVTRPKDLDRPAPSEISKTLLFPL